jgi:diamine N-acetyltransferase
MFGSFLPSLRSSINHSLLGSRSRHCYAIKWSTGTQPSDDPTSCELRPENPKIYTPDSRSPRLGRKLCPLRPIFVFALLILFAAAPVAVALGPGWREMEFSTRLCRPGDEQALSLIAQATILETYAGITDGDDLIEYVTAESSVADFSRIVASDRMRAWIAETVVGKCVVGYAVAVSDEDARSFSSFELKRLYVFYRFHGNGLGKRLMEDVLSFAKQMKSEAVWLQVHEANIHAIEFYKRFGFVQTGVDLFRAGEGSYRVLHLALTLARQV